MHTYYNEFDPKAASWLRELCKNDLISHGDVDERSIVDVAGSELIGYERVHLFAGIGGWDYALQLAGWPESVPVWTGSCPCQPFSSAGKRKGTADERHLWPEMRRLIGECRPPVVFGEQVASKAGREWLAGVRADLEALGYAVGAADLCAACVGAPHIRQRLYWVADACVSGLDEQRRNTRGKDGEREPRRYEPIDRRDHGGLADASHADRGSRECGAEAGAWADGERGRGSASGGEAGGLGYADAPGPQRLGRPLEGASERPAGATGLLSPWSDFEIAWCRNPDGGDPIPRRIEPGSFPLAHGVSGRVAVRRTVLRAGSQVEEVHWYNRVAALRGLGNAIVPQVAAAFIASYLDTIS